jgi:predicted enzyme related to lactoylglutathione lyase
MQIDVLFAGVPVTDLGAAASWYERLLGRPADIIVNENEVMWMIAENAWLYVVVDAQRAGRALVAMALPDLDDAAETITARGIDVESTETIPGAGRKAYFVDPDGNSIAIIEVVQPAS